MQIVAAERFAGVDANVSFFPLLKIPDTFIGLAFHFKYFFGNLIECLTGIGQNQFFADMINEFYFIILLDSLNSFGNGGLGYKEFGGGRTEVPMFWPPYKKF